MDLVYFKDFFDVLIELDFPVFHSVHLTTVLHDYLNPLCQSNFSRTLENPNKPLNIFLGALFQTLVDFGLERNVIGYSHT